MSTVNIIRVVAVVALVAIMVWFFAGSSITDLFSGGGSGGADNDGTVSSVTVSRNRVVCESVTGQNCLVIDGELFYQEIEDFDFQTGCEYQIRIQKREVFSSAAVPEDSSRYRYRLLEIETRNCLMNTSGS